jgi:hypothetical protein
MHALLVIITWIGVSLLLGYIGRDKKFGFWGNFLVTLLLSPLVGIILYFAQSDKHSKAPAKSKSHDHESDEASTHTTA